MCIYIYYGWMCSKQFLIISQTKWRKQDCLDDDQRTGLRLEVITPQDFAVIVISTPLTEHLGEFFCIQIHYESLFIYFKDNSTYYKSVEKIERQYLCKTLKTKAHAALFNKLSSAYWVFKYWNIHRIVQTWLQMVTYFINYK